MAATEPNKKVLPRDAAHLLAIEDQLKKIEGIIRDIRLGMSNADMPSVDLATGTIFHFMGKIEGLAEKYQGAFKTQRATHAAKRLKEREKADRATGAKTRARK